MRGSLDGPEQKALHTALASTLLKAGGPKDRTHAKIEEQIWNTDGAEQDHSNTSPTSQLRGYETAHYPKVGYRINESRIQSGDSNSELRQ